MSSENQEPRHPIRVVSRRTGITQDLLRAWERRYDAVVPHRSGTGRRLYTDLDIERLALMKRAVDAGRRISDVAEMNRKELQSLTQEDEAAQIPSPQAPQRVISDLAGADHLSRAMAAVEELDRHGLEEALSEAAVDLGNQRLRREVIVPLMEQVGSRWREGSLRVVHEHLASSIIRNLLGAMREEQGMPVSAPRLIVTTPAGQIHEFGALLAAVAAVESGWEVIYLGPNLPAEEIAAAVRLKNARAVAISIIYPSHDPRLHDELRQLRRFLGPDLPILVGGRSAAAFSEVLQAIGAFLLEDLDKMQDELENLAS